MKEVIEGMPKLIEALKFNDELKEVMGENFEHGITTRPRLNFTEVNEKYGLYSYVALSMNRMEGFVNEDVVIFKANVVVDLSNNEDPASLALRIADIVIKEFTKKELEFGFAEQLEFGEMEETYFDLDQMSWGYVILFGVSKQPVWLLISS